MMIRIIEAFFWGIITALASVFLEVAFLGGYVTSGLSASAQTIAILLVGSALIEETLKFIVIYKSLFRLITGKYRWVGVFFFGIGFSAVEISIISQYAILSSDNWLEIAGILAVHLATTGLLATTAFRVKSMYSLRAFLSILAVTGLHVGYNSLIHYESAPFWATPSLMVSLFVIMITAYLSIGKNLAR